MEILRQHARERRLASILFLIAVLVLCLIQWRISTVVQSNDTVTPVESR